MSLKTYQAYSMAEALAAVKNDLGNEAVILHTRTFKRGGILGIGRQTIVEVTAGPPDTLHRTQGLRLATKSRTTSRTARQAYAKVSTKKSSSTTRRRNKPTDQEKTRRLAAALAKKSDAGVSKAGPAIALEIEDTPERAQATLKAERRVMLDGQSPPPRRRSAKSEINELSEAEIETRSIKPVAQRYVLQPTESSSSNSPSRKTKSPSRSDGKKNVSTGNKQKVPKRASAGPVRLFMEDVVESVSPTSRKSSVSTHASGDAVQEVQSELSAIRTMVSQVLQRQTSADGRPTPTMPQTLFDMYLKLIGQDLSEELADQIVNEVRSEIHSDMLDNERVVHDSIVRHLSALIPVAETAVAKHSPDERPLTIALIGPTGVGKTTTVAKLAASFKLQHRRKVGLITSDTYRIAAVDQLRTYANIIGLPLEVALTPSDMRMAVHALSECDVIIIDTAGRSQNDTNRLEELQRFLAAADPHEVHLVLSSTASEKVLIREAEAFSKVGVEKIVLTKLDEAVSFGMLINVIRQVGKKLSFVTTGQEVPDHIELGRADRLAELVMGGELNA